ncbi:DUF1754-domain-containing protein [Aulographum hederae CBS 113979]|uniref:DUF1754-domain-containing protein n=1 Tax=Aulographum hederae CBS 113979 TaxID=1176131 RepID=A0A6G1H0G4_9PEZI|nr:DUF1754-domain-containing protein [Aulographum hederae CBS 113979]
MPSDEYTPVSSGALKLKGATNAGISKKKKKKKSKPSTTVPASDGEAEVSSSSFQKVKGNERSLQDALAAEDEDEDGEDGEEGEGKEGNGNGKDGRLMKELVEFKGKTETERRFEERRRQRLNERLMKEGVKTHKERVEELNRYLANLSEHHDMPRIGPG